MEGEDAHCAIDAPPRRVPIFFYGLFMDAEILRRQGVAPSHPRRAEVRGMVLRIGKRATLVPSVSGTAHGVLMDLTHDDIHRLYAEESVALYRPEAVMARMADGTSIPALCFNLPAAPAPHEANPAYARRLGEIGLRLGLPSDYLASLE